MTEIQEGGSISYSQLKPLRISREVRCDWSTLVLKPAWLRPLRDLCHWEVTSCAAREALRGLTTGDLAMC
jgi:hypothetical protein